MDNQLEVRSRAFAHGIVVDVKGDITKQAEDSLLALQPWEQGLEHQKRYLVLNFSEVPYINSAGIAIIIRIVRSGRKGGFQTFAYGLHSHYEKLFRMVGLTEYVMIYPNEYAIMERIETLQEMQ